MRNIAPVEKAPASGTESAVNALNITGRKAGSRVVSNNILKYNAKVPPLRRVAEVATKFKMSQRDPFGINYKIERQTKQ